jgi:uncharacterized protein YfaS (alpha-2-macroglobulin family)
MVCAKKYKGVLHSSERFLPSNLRGDVMVKKRKKLVGTVQKIIKSPYPTAPEKAQIEINEGEELYREIRIENKLTDDQGNTVKLKEGADVEVIIEADSSATIKKPD